MNEFTYGNSPAAVMLAKIITEKYPNRASKVGRYMTEMHRNMFLVITCHSTFKYDMRMLERMLLECKTFHISRIQNSNLPSEIKTFMLNIISKTYRVWLKVLQGYSTKYLNERNKSHLSV